MKKFYLLFLLSLIAFQDISATHLIGGEMRYEYLGPGSTANTKQYRIRLLLLRGPGGATFISQYIVGVFNNDNGAKVIGPAFNSNWAAVQDTTVALPVPIIVSPCIQNPPFLSYTYKSYSFIIELPNNNTGYTVAFQTYSRQFAQNITNDQGATYSCVIPGLNTLPAPLTDNSPKFNLPVSVICANSDFTLDFGATDVDGDSLVYSFCIAYNGGLANQADYQDPVGPPYSSVNYTPPFNSSIPLGPLASINPHTGIISGVAPDPGKYVVCVCISVYRNGSFIGIHRKDLIVEVSPCIPTNADPDPGYVTCDGFNIQFNHASTGASTVFWDFGDPSTDADTSILNNPVYIYPDTGIFHVKFIINKGGNCTDSSTITMGIYPGFFPGFVPVAPFCRNVPVQFTDTTLTNYGFVDSWSWNFGDLSTLADTSHLQNPLYTYSSPGTYTATLVVTNSKGCVKTTTHTVTILDNPVLTAVSPDSTYCRLDSLQLTASGTGNFNWTPATNIIGANTATPTVFPSGATQYIVTLESSGCRSRDTVNLNPLNDLTNAIISSRPSICEGDTLSLTGSSNHTNVSWQWSPSASLSSANTQVTNAFPITTTTYTLQTRWGNNCVATTTRNIPVTPLAMPNAGPDTSYCTGQTGIPLAASGGATYTWTPAAGLSNPNIATPIATPATTTTYYVAVGVTGCSRTRTDSVRVIVRPKPALQMPNDTLICVIDTLLLNAAGTGSFVWTPNYNINNTSAATPLVSPDVPTMYHVRLTDMFNCFRLDSVFVDVKADVTVDAGNDTSICRTEGYMLNTTGDAVSYSWSPTTGLSDPEIMNPVATPLVNTTYTVTANIGKCERTSEVSIVVAPIPVPDAGLDKAVCIGFNTQIGASGGSIYEWSPTTYLSNPNIANPMVIQPQGNIKYVVTVRDTLGCIKAVKDSVFVQVIPQLNVDAGPADTSVVEGEPLALFATGAVTYLWTPDQWLSNPNVNNPIALPDGNILYRVTGMDASGCLGSDSIMVNLFRLDPDMYVPTAFTPNGDGNNDIIKPILIGMRSLNYFRVYNRFGQMMYSTSEIGKGWNGIFNGKAQDMATFVWMAEGVTYKGVKKTKKGYVVLIR